MNANLARTGALLAAVAAVPNSLVGAMQVEIRDYQRLTAYHSAQTPGYTSWAGIVAMLDGSVLLSFTEITGSADGWRQRAPASVLKRMPTAQQEIPAYDMTGLAQENVYLRSTDRGDTWTPVSADPFSSCLNGYCGGGALVIADGTILRLGWGQSLTYCDVRPTGFLQRSTDGAKTWGPPEYLSDQEDLQAFPTRIRRLRDGRLIVTGGAAPFDPENWQWMDILPKTRHCLWVSDDPTGRSWSQPTYVTPQDAGFACEEWDFAELENGDLLAVFRAIVYGPTGEAVSQDRRQGILARDGDTWKPGPITMTPFPHSGHPELLSTREGVILHIAPTGMAGTADQGLTWTPLDYPGSGYYPHAVQLDDGTILVAGHVGNDDFYGKTDQSIVLDRFRLQVQ